MSRSIVIDYAAKLHPVFTRPKRIKIIVGGRGSTKSTAIADHVATQMTMGKLWCCAREQLNSIEESVHRTILDEIDRIGIPGFTDTKTNISHKSGGRNFYRGLARNISSLKSTLSGVDGLWIEEGEDLSANTLRVLTACVRLNAKDTQRAMAGEEVKMPEIIITMNRGSRNDPMSKRFLARAEPDLERHGFYEDDMVMIVEVNYTDIPHEWFMNSGLETERADDEKNMEPAEYEAKWLGKYYDSVENAIIKPKWFDAAIDAHKKLGITPAGITVVSHDPSDLGSDPKGLAYRHGILIKDALFCEVGDVNEGCDWALEYALNVRPDRFVWDGDGMGVGLRRQIGAELKGKNIIPEMYQGSTGVDDPMLIYEEINEAGKEKKTNSDSFRNKRAQYYWSLRDRFFRTYQAVEEGKYVDPTLLISISSDIKAINLLRSELCRIPLRQNQSGFIQICTKVEMRKMKIPSPNMADAVMMAFSPQVHAINAARREVVRDAGRARAWT